MMVSFFHQRDAPQRIRMGLRSAFPDYRFLARTDPKHDIHDGPYVTVISAGTPSHGEATASENVHITVYASSAPVARDLAVIIDGLLLSPSINWGFAISPGPGLNVEPDEVTGGFVASVTVVAGSPKFERNLL